MTDTVALSESRTSSAATADCRGVILETFPLVLSNPRKLTRLARLLVVRTSMAQFRRTSSLRRCSSIRNSRSSISTGSPPRSSKEGLVLLVCGAALDPADVGLPCVTGLVGSIFASFVVGVAPVVV